MPRTGFIDHIGIGVLDLAAAKCYYDELMPVLGLKQWFPTSADGSFDTALMARPGRSCSSTRPSTTATTRVTAPVCNTSDSWWRPRAIVWEAHQWAAAHDAEIVHEPREFPEYGEHYATYWLDPHGIMLEAVCHTPEAG